MRTAREALRRDGETSALTADLAERFEAATACQVITLVAT
jgi:hypothetical protein